MGSSHPNKNLLDQYNVQNMKGHTSILSKKDDIKIKYLMKTLITTSEEQHQTRLCYYKNHKKIMEQNQELIKIVEIIEQKDDHFCSSSMKLHIIYEYSTINIGMEIKQRRQNMLKIKNKTQKKEGNSKYFNYEDLTNILYSCLSALWFAKQLIQDCPDIELRRFKTIFISTQEILIFGNGILKVMEPLVMDFGTRYRFRQNIYYSPEKLEDFNFIDDQKCSLFELGMALLEISLLQSMNDAYFGFQYKEEVVIKKIQKAKRIYSYDIQNSLTISIFDLIEKMVQKDREERYNLEEAIKCAEQMYESQETSIQEISPTNMTKFYTNSNNKELNKTNHSSNGKNSPKTNKFNNFKNSAVQYRDENYIPLSPKLSNFTIREVDAEKQENSSMLQSLQIDNAPINNFNSIAHQGIFSNIQLGQSYKYEHLTFNQLSQTPKYNILQQSLFTDPELLRTIHRQLQIINERKILKKSTCNVNNLMESKVVERRDRHNAQQQLKTKFKINHAVYL